MVNSAHGKISQNKASNYCVPLEQGIHFKYIVFKMI